MPGSGGGDEEACGVLDIGSWWWVAIVAAVAAVTWVLLVRRWRRSERRTARLATALLAAVLSTAAVADGVNAYFAYLPHVSDVAEAATGGAGRPTLAHVLAGDHPHPRGVVATASVPDRGSGFGASQALVWLPPQYFTQHDERFPVVYLFHGSPGTPSDWFQGGQAPAAGLAAARAGRPAIVVAPRMSHGWLDDPECVDGVHEHVESHFLDDVVPTVDAGLRTEADRDGRVLAGMSAGGYCALDLGLRHRDLASTVIDMSGLTEPTHTGGLQTLFGPDPAIVAADARATSPALYAPTLPPGPPLRIWFDVGRDDHETRGPIEAIAPVLQARGVDVHLHERAGAHTFHVWAPALLEALPWAVGPSAVV